MGGLATLVEQEARAAHPRAAAVHAARLHDDVVVGPVVGVGQQRLQPAADAVALQVASDHAQFTGNGFFIAVEPVHERRVGDHAGQAGQLRGVGTAARHFGEKVHQHWNHRHTGEFDRPLQHRQVSVKPLARQQRAARRARHTHDTVDHDALGAHGGGQVLQFLALRGVFGAGEEVEVLLVDGPQRGSANGRGPVHAAIHAAGHKRQHFGHQAAARMRDEVQPRALREGPHQRQRIGDRACAHGGVVERIDTAAIVRKQLTHTLRVQRPELAEGAARVDESAVDQHQQRLLRRVGGGRHLRDLQATALEHRECFALERIHAGIDLTVNLGHHLAGDEVDRLVLEEVGQDVEARQQHVAQKAAAARGRGLFQAAPTQLRRDDDIAAVGCGRGGAAAFGGALAQHQVARRFGVQHQRRAAGDAQHDDVFARHGGDTHAVDARATTAARGHAHGVLHATGQAGRGRAGKVGAAAAGLALAGDDESDGCLVGGGSHGSRLLAGA